MKNIIKEYLKENLSEEKLGEYEDSYVSDCDIKGMQFDLYKFMEYVKDSKDDEFLDNDGYLSIVYLGVLIQSELFNIDILDLLTEENTRYLLEWKENNKERNLDNYDDKYEKGYDEGYAKGYDEGYEQGFIDCKDNKEVNK